MTKSFVKRLESLTDLLPPQGLTPLTADWFRQHRPKLEEQVMATRDQEASFDLWLSAKPVFKDRIVKTFLNVRSNSDLGIRRTRLRDTYTAYAAAGERDVFVTRMRRILAFDIVAVPNLLNAAFLLSGDFDWFGFWDSLGAYDGGIAHWIVVTKFVSDKLKSNPRSTLPLFDLIECAALVGYRQLPFPGFKIYEDAVRLAHGGGRHGLVPAARLMIFSSLAEQALKMSPVAPWPWVSFEDYVLRGRWETSGSASIGRVEWSTTVGGKVVKGKFKARKNLIAEVVSESDMLTVATGDVRQDNYTIIKSEPGKLRLAVATDIKTYWRMDYVLLPLRHAYKDWAGSTVDETPREQTNRMREMLDTIITHFNLPFDYKEFDHQANTDEIVIIMAEIFKFSRMMVDDQHRAEYDRSCDIVIASFDKAYLIVKATTAAQAGEKTTPVLDGDTLLETDQALVDFFILVLGGVMSGWRFTSLLSNAWNSIMTLWVIRLLEFIGVPMEAIRRWIRGDDSAISLSTYEQCLLFRLCYQAVGAESVTGKYGILFGESEFLRTRYDADGCHGYTARGLVGLTQRKPWNADPWTPEASMVHIYDAVRTLERRGASPRKLAVWWGAVKRVWSQVNHRSTDWLQVPVALGGFGCEPWDGETLPVERYKGAKFEPRILNLMPDKVRRVAAEFRDITTLNHDEAIELTTRIAVSKMTADDVPGVSAALRESVKIPEAGFRRDFYTNPNLYENALGASSFCARLTADGSSWDAVDAAYPAGRWGKFKRDVELWRRLQMVARVKKMRPMDEMRRRAPEWYFEVRRLEAMGLSRTEAVDYTFGTTPSGTLRRIHSMLAGLITQVAVSVCKGLFGGKLKPGEWTMNVHRVARFVEAGLYRSELSQRIYLF